MTGAQSSGGGSSYTRSLCQRTNREARPPRPRCDKGPHEVWRGQNREPRRCRTQRPKPHSPSPTRAAHSPQQQGTELGHRKASPSQPQS